MSNDPLLDRQVVNDVCQADLRPEEILKLGKDARGIYVRKARRRLRRNLRILQGVLAAVEIVAAIVIFLVIYLAPVAIDVYPMCFYSLIGTPGVFLPLQLDLGCLSPALIATITLLLHGVVYRLIFMLFFMFDEYYSGLSVGRYNNRFRWMFRGAAYPAYYLIALHVSGLRDFITGATLIFIAFSVEMFRWITERKRDYAYSLSKQRVFVSKSGRSAFYASVLFSGIVMAAQLAYWIAYIAQDLGAVQTITWLYGIVFLLLYAIFSIWVWVVMGKSEFEYQERMKIEYGWEIFQTAALVILTICAVIGAAVL